MRTDEELMEEVASGDFSSFEELIRRHQSWAFGIAYNILKNSHVAEEITQEAFLKIIRNADSYEPTATFRTYLSRVVTRLCTDKLEKNEPASFDESNFSNSNQSLSDPLEETLEKEQTNQIEHALGELPTTQRTAIVLQIAADQTYEQIAETMDTTIKAVERLLHRARKNLREELVDLSNVEQ